MSLGTPADSSGYVALSERPYGAHAKLIDLVGPGKRVLDVGCSSGYLARPLVERGCTVVGVEQDDTAAEGAREVCVAVLVGDVEAMELPFEPGSFDVVLCGDLIEHLRDPERFFERVRPVLAPEGRLVLSTPNVANWAIRVGLLAGRWRYTDRGILDRTHTRLFTRRTLVEALEGSGYRVVVLDFTTRSRSSGRRRSNGSLTRLVDCVRRYSRTSSSSRQNRSSLDAACPPGPTPYSRSRAAVADHSRRPPDRGMSAPRTIAIVPARNEAEAIRTVVEAIREFDASFEVVVVDDGSTDRTAARARGAGARVVSLPFNLGIGGAVQTGFKLAQEEGFELAVRLDGDGQHIASELPKLLAPIHDGTADIVVGSRFAGPSEYQPPLARRLGIRLFASVVSLLTRQRVTDTTSGFQACNRKAIRLFAADYPHDYPEVEATVMVFKHRLRFTEVPVSMREREVGRSSIGGFWSVYYAIKVLLAVFMALSRRYATPLEEEA